MNDEIIFLVLFFVLIFTGTGIRRYYLYKIEKTRQRLSVRERIEEMIRAEGRNFAVILMAQGAYLLVLLMLYLLFSSSFLLFHMPLPNWLRWLGVGLGFLSVPFLAWVHYVLDKNWSITLKLQTDHQLVTSGPYRRIRHPMYAVLIMYELSWVLFPLISCFSFTMFSQFFLS
jgi:protein-S-isoprenylcysteine O-methyltransferase Ste14